MKCYSRHIKEGVIFKHNRSVDGGRTTPQTKNANFIGKSPVLILQGDNEYLETKTLAS